MQSTLLPLCQASRRQINSSLGLVKIGWQYRTPRNTQNHYQRLASTGSDKIDNDTSTSESQHFPASGSSSSPSSSGPTPNPSQKSPTRPSDLPPDWDENPDYNIQAFKDLPSANFGVNQHIVINDEFKEALRQILWNFRAPIRYAFAYGSGVFPQTGSSLSRSSKPHPNPSPAISTVQKGNGKMIDFIFGVSYTQHWHSMNLQQHRGHYSAVGTLGSAFVSRVQDQWGAGIYFNPYVTVNGTLIKYGVVNLDTLCRDLSTWDTLYLAGRLQKPVKILRDDPRVRLANQVNLISAVRTALLLLPPEFSEKDLYNTIAGISYLGDPRMSLGAENLNKVSNIVKHQLPNFRRLYAPLIENLPNVSFHDSRCNSPSWVDDPDTNATLVQDMDPTKRGNMVRRLPKNFREKLYFQYRSKYQIPQLEFNKMMDQTNDEDPSRIKRKQGGPFEQRIASDNQVSLNKEVSAAITKIIQWPSWSQSTKALVTSGFLRSWRYLMEKREKYREGRERGAQKSGVSDSGKAQDPDGKGS
ncbi:Phosphatidate cytidylyltransferase, mitochondrial [Imshaugia aleurites]|uniref:Phosphatidate cytidylyltransferase, mitochondrial n=1 Tax=Imshaugia aleurites TaxID=172621 RepID=A0A8H3FWQ8_9LECA|nr:Phosphatidate cytidylyltransferase, mitochondrial [Imshaugia aleurites]